MDDDLFKEDDSDITKVGKVDKDFYNIHRDLQWNPVITKCHGTEKNVRYSGVFIIAKTPL